MPRRTLAEARRVLEEEVVPGVSDHWANTYRDVLKQVEERARARALEYVAAREQEVRQARDEALRELTAVRDALEDLTAQGKAGRIPAREYSHTLYELRGRQEQAEQALGKVKARAEHIAAVEDDPLAWADDLARRHPRVMPEVPW